MLWIAYLKKVLITYFYRIFTMMHGLNNTIETWQKYKKKKIGPTLKIVDFFTPDKHFNLYSFSSKQNLAMQQRKNPYP